MLKNSSQNNGVAVIRIEDNRNGMEGYTGDIFWNGGNNDGGNWNGGWNGGGGGGNNNDWGIGNNNNWNKNNVVMNCQNTIRRKIQQDSGGASVNFNGSPRVNKAGSSVMVDGNGNGRANNGSQRNFHLSLLHASQRQRGGLQL